MFLVVGYCFCLDRFMYYIVGMGRFVRIGPMWGLEIEVLLWVVGSCQIKAQNGFVSDGFRGYD